MSNQLQDEMVQMQIHVNGKAIDAAIQIASVEIKRAVSSIGSAVLLIALNPEQDLADVTEFTVFAPGNQLEIQAGYGGLPDTIFKGMILQQGVRTGNAGNLEIIVDCSEDAIRMTLGRKSAFFRQKTDAEIISALIAQNGLSAETDSTLFIHPQLIQCQSTDWDYIRSRAAANGLLVYTEGNKVNAKAPQYEQSPTLTATFGVDILQVDLRHDVSTHQTGVASKVLGKGLINTSAQTLKGTMTISGNAKLKINSPIALKGFGARFDGHALVAGIHHTIQAGIWTTSLGFGWQVAEETVLAPMHTLSADGMLPAMTGLQTGRVKQMDQDPEGEYRILVEVPAFDPTGEGIWARMVQSFVGNQAGSYFLPDPGSEVILSFFNNDPRYPVILGSCYSSQNPAPFEPRSENHIKGLVTKNHLSLSFDDEHHIVTIQTPAGNKFSLSETDQSVLIQDQNGQRVIMNQDGIQLNSLKDLVLKADGNIVFQAKGDLQLQGLNVKATADVALKVSGAASAELSAGGQTVVKGGMVMIN
ncbi:MAG TPA: phage baseplate assembly protein V [Saprospiraceae bacterium]|nr:phage baseplate assembly protein V [Saprospiraceae bacterium]